MKLRFVIDKAYDKKFLHMSNPVVKKHFDEIYKNGSRYLKYTQKQYQLAWDEIGQDFSDYIEKETGYKWFYPTYTCVVSVTQQGISNWGHEARILRGWKENPYSQRRITAHELIISHYFEIYRRHYSDHHLTDNQVWALAEIAAFALTTLTSTAQKFWPWDFFGYEINLDYPKIIELQKKLKSVFLKKKTFDEYIEKGIALVKTYQDIGP